MSGPEVISLAEQNRQEGEDVVCSGLRHDMGADKLAQANSVD